MRLENVKEGDAVAFFSRDGLRKKIAGHTTATRVTIDGQSFVRRTGRVFGQGSDRRWNFSATWAEQWGPEHDETLARDRVERKLSASRRTLSGFKWQEVTQEQADAMLAAMQAAGLLTTEDAAKKAG